MPPSKGSGRKRRFAKAAASPKRTSRPRFVGRDPSPVLERYPAKDTAPPPPRVASVVAPPASRTSASVPSTAPSTPPVTSQPLITLDRPFDLDEFSTLLGETSIRVTVPREALGEVLHRVLEFMGFGIYVYAISVRPAPAELLKSFVVELQRVDYAPEKGAWAPFVEKGTTDSPFGPSGQRS